MSSERSIRSVLGPRLREALESSDVRRRREAALRVLQSRNWRDRLQAVRAVADWQLELAELLPRPLTKDSAASVRRACAVALGEAVARVGTWAITKALGCWHDLPARSEDVAALGAALRDRDAGVREAAARSLGRLSEAQECMRSKGGLWGNELRASVAKLCAAALPLLAAAHATDRTPRVRCAALLALGRLGWPEAVAPLVALIEKNAERAGTEEALWILRAGGASEALAGLASHAADPFVRAKAIYLVEVDKLPPPVAAAAVTALLSYLPDPGLRELAAGALAASRDPRVIEPFIAILRDPQASDWLVTLAAQGLSRHTQDPRCIEPLIEALRTRKVGYLAYTLCGVKDPRVIEPLADFLRAGCEPYQAAQIGQALAQLGGPVAEARLRELKHLIPEDTDDRD